MFKPDTINEDEDDEDESINTDVEEENAELIECDKELNKQSSSAKYIYNLEIILSFLFLFCDISLLTGFESFTVSVAMYVMNITFEDAQVFVGIYLIGCVLGKVFTIILFKFFQPNIIIVIQSFGVWTCVLVYILLFNWFSQYSNKSVLYFLLLFSGIFISGEFCCVMAFLNMFQVLTGFLSSMLLVGFCFGGAIAGIGYGFIISYYDQHYTVVVSMMFVLASTSLFLAISMFTGHQRWVKITSI